MTSIENNMLLTHNTFGLYGVRTFGCSANFVVPEYLLFSARQSRHARSDSGKKSGVTYKN